MIFISWKKQWIEQASHMVSHIMDCTIHKRRLESNREWIIWQAPTNFPIPLRIMRQQRMVIDPFALQRNPAWPKVTLFKNMITDT